MAVRRAATATAIPTTTVPPRSTHTTSTNARPFPHYCLTGLAGYQGAFIALTLRQCTVEAGRTLLSSAPACSESHVEGVEVKVWVQSMLLRHRHLAQESVGHAPVPAT